jgi:signal transduction histidine kinase
MLQILPHRLCSKLRQALLLLVVLLPVLAQASDLIRSKAVLEDADGSLNIQQVESRTDFSSLSSMLVKGYTDSAFWLRIDVAPAPDGSPIKLRIRPTFADEVRLYVPDPTMAGGWRQRVSGDHHPFNASDRTANSLGFVVLPQVPTTYYLRLKTTSSSILHVQALGLADANQKDAVLVLFQMGYLAFIVSVLLWSLHEYWKNREPVMLSFAMYQAVSVAFSMALIGYLAPFEPADWNGWMDSVTSMLIMGVAMSGMVFHSVTLALYSPNRWLLRGLWALAAWVPIQMLFYLLGHERWALQVNALVVLVSGVLMISLSLSAKREGLPSRRILRAVYGLQTLSIAATMLPYLGWIDAVEWSLQSTLVHGLISAALMFFMLYKRSQLLHSEAEKYRQSTALTLQQLNIQTQHVAEQDRFIDMLTHELKTPISVAIMSLGASDANGPYIARAKRALGNLNAIVERTRLSALADSQRLQFQPALCNVSALLYECIDSCSAPDRVKALVGFELETVTDSQLLTLVITNLIENALKYSRQDSVIDVTLARDSVAFAHQLCLQVTNTLGAAGAPDPAKVFSKYYRSRGAQSQSGTGLGLYLSQNLAQLIGARLHYQQDADRLTFSLCLPSSLD